MPGGTSKKARGKHRLDKFYQLAKDQGYRSRAAFKLIQLNKKHGFLNDARAVLDLCAAPGGWLQVCAKHLPLSARIIGVDLVSIKPVRGVKTLVEDITTTSCREKLHKESGGSLFDVVLHDGAPNVGGAFATEMYTQSALVLDSLKLACDFLRPEGTFVTKIFRSRDYTALLFAFRQLFARVDATKPQASRATSAEIFVVCSGYKAPAKIDPRLLDHRSLFQDLEEPAQAMGPDALLNKIGKKHRHRTGYETGTSLLHKTVSAVSFIRCKDPMPILANTSSIVLDPSKVEASKDKKDGAQEGDEDSDKEDSEEESAGRFSEAEALKFVLKHKESIQEVKALCGDLQVLGRSEFKQLLRWRMKIRKDLEAAEKTRANELKAEAGEEEGDTDDDEECKKGDADMEKRSAEDVLIKEMEGLREKEVADAKRSRRKRRELKKKAKIRLAQAAAVAGVGEEQDLGEEALFSLNIIKGSKALQSTGDADALDADTVAATLEAPNSDSEMASSESEDEQDPYGSDEEAAAAAAYDANVEKQLDDAYESYLQRRHARDAIKAEKQKRSRLRDAGEGDADEAAAQAAKGIAALPSHQGESDSEAEEGERRAGGGLLVDFGPKATAAATTQQWFSQPVFQDEGLLTDDAMDEMKDMPSDDAMEEDAPAWQPEKKSLQGKRKAPPAIAATEQADDDSEEDVSDVHVPLAVLASPGGAVGKGEMAHPTLPPDLSKQQQQQPKSAQKGPAGEVDSDDEDDEGAIRALKEASGAGRVGGWGRKDTGELEVVPQDRDGNESTDTEDEFAALDEHAQAEVRAMARKWLGGRKGELSLMDAAYNRYTFDDEGVPRWFREDERRHMQPAAVVSREEVAAEKQQLRSIDARSLKKVVEAKARKRRRVGKKLEAARHKAEGIADGEDMSAHRKASEIGKLYAKAKAAGRDKRKGGAANAKNLSRSAREKAKRKGPPLDRRMIADKMKGAAKAITKGKRKGGKGKGRGR